MINQDDIIATAYLFMIVSGIIIMFGGLTVYLNKRSLLREASPHLNKKARRIR